ncbi:hypothetical protein RKD26_000711 [Streptomyces calvus]
MGAERLEVVQVQFVAGQVQLGVEGQRGVARREDEAVAARPFGVGRIVPHHLLKDRVGGRGEAHRGAGMAVADLLHGIGRQQAGGVDGTPVQVGPVQRVRCLRAHLQEILDPSGRAPVVRSKVKV